MNDIPSTLDILSLLEPKEINVVINDKVEISKLQEHMHQAVNYLLSNDIRETKRYNRHKDSCRQILNDYITSNYINRDFSKIPLINSGMNEPLCKFISMAILSYYENLLRKQIDDEIFQPLAIDKLTFNLPNPYFSIIESYMLNIVEKEHDTIINDLQEIKTHFADKMPNTNNLIDIFKHLIGENAKLVLNQELTKVSNIMANYIKFITDTSTESPDMKISPTLSCNIVQIVNKCFDQFFYNYILCNWYNNLNINENNYISFTKFTEDSCYSFLLNLVTLVKYEVENVFVEKFWLTTNEEYIKDEYTKLFDLKSQHEQEYTEQKQNESELIKQNQQLDAQLKNEKDSKSSLEKSLLETISNLNKTNKENQNTITELTNQYNDMVNYYESVINSMTKPSNDEPTIINVDKYKKYIFIANEDIKNETLYNIISTEFPNSKIIYSDFNLLPDSDLVIFLTSILDHSTYFMVKNQCISKDIPYIHCHKRNINDIKTEISKFI